MKRNTILVQICSLLICVNISANTAFTGMRNITSMQVTADMGPGINLCNTLDAYPNETSWGNPLATLALITSWKQKGFKTIRIPVTWKDHIGAAPDYIIDPTWLARVETVVNYAFANDMYVCLNTHHEDWIQPTYANQVAGSDKLVKVWTQIANRFKSYGDYLIFETMNEPRAYGSPEEWTGGSAEHRDVVNAFNLAAVNAIRNTGGNNATRHIMIPTCGDNPSIATLNALVIPNNDSRVIVTVHIYDPYLFCLALPGDSAWGTAADKAALDAEFNVIYNKFIVNGRAVVVGEWGAEYRNNPTTQAIYNDYFVKACLSRQMAEINWMYVFDRNSLTWNVPLAVDAIIKPYNIASVAVTGVTIDKTIDTLFVGDSIKLTATINPFNATINTVSWTSSNTSIATVSTVGMVIGIVKGTATITVTTLDKGKTAICTIIVIDKPQIPYNGIVHHIPGTFEAEDFDEGGQQVAYFDDSNTNQGGLYRITDRVDIESNGTGGYSIGWFNTGEWMEYTCHVDKKGIYQADFLAATTNVNTTGHIEINGISLGGTVGITNTGGWQTWQIFSTKSFTLDTGTYVIRFVNDGVSFNIDKITINLLSKTQTIALKKGWNLISTNVVPNDSTIATLFSGLDVQEIKSMDAFWRKGLNLIFNKLTTINTGNGYLVNMNVAGNLIISGLPLINILYPPAIKTGWQLIGCPYLTTTVLSNYFNTTNCASIKNFDGFWIPNGTTNSINNLDIGKGYFLKGK
jgi:endoglucanase